MDFEEIQVQIGKESENLQPQEEGTNTQDENAYLQVLRLNKEGMVPSFEKDIYEYYLTVPDSVKEIEVVAISENPNANVDITGNTKLKEGLNTIKIQITSENGKVKRDYKIQVTKTKNLELANTNLEILAVENALLNPPFDANETMYKIEVSNNTKNLNIFAVPENENAKVKISGGENLKEGSNIVTVIVTAANGFSTKKYTIEVYRRNIEEQTKFEEEEGSQAEKVAKAYEIDKTSSDDNMVVEEGGEKKEEAENKNIVIWVVIAIISTTIIIGIIVWRKKHE